MDPSLEVWRHERKLLPAGNTLRNVLLGVRLHPAGFREVYPPRQVNNIYFDTPTLDDFHHHVDGASARQKTRIRWYGPLRGDIASPVLERKIKQGAVSRKVSHDLPPITVNGHIEGRSLRAACGAPGLPASVRHHLHGLLPALVNRYHRRYFLSGDGAVRLTVDTDLEFYSPRRTTRRLAASGDGDDLVVIELKYAPSQATTAAAITSRLPFRLARCSKYVLGVQRLYHE